MIDHIYLPVTNIKRSLAFYSALLIPLVVLGDLTVIPCADLPDGQPAG